MTRMDVSAPITILVHEFVTGGGLAGTPLPASWAAEGGAMRRALAADFAAVAGVRVVVTLDDRLPDEPGPCELVRVGPGQEMATLSRLAARADCTAVIAPETGGILAERVRVVEGSGGRSLGSSPEAIALAGDKYRLGLHLAARGIITPEGRLVVPAEGLPEETVYPAVLKPVDGAGAIDTYYLEDSSSLTAQARSMPRALLQPFVEGQPMSASFLVDVEGRARLLGIANQQIARQGQRLVSLGDPMTAVSAPPVDEARRAIESLSGLLGFVGVDFVWDASAGRVTVIEVNPRLTTSFVTLRRSFPSGTMARAWLEAVHSRQPKPDSP
jgi:predicted ATP-grasp superfamily ATP-dependent carboligase